MIFSFYSFKGGVGRTQLLANIASYLCYYRDYKILIIDWDMEAPGCHYFFTDEQQPITFDKDGVLETFQAYCDLVREKGNDAKPEDRPYFTKEKNVYELKKSASGKGVIDLIPAGNYSEGIKFYQQASGFDWIEFHERLGGKNYLEYIKKQLKNKKLGFDYDFIFIDSRTGISDYTNMVNIQMSECDVLVMAPNTQNFAGSKLMAERIENSPYVTKRAKQEVGETVYRYDYIIPILSRWDSSAENGEFWRKEFFKTFSYLLEKEEIGFAGISKDYNTFWTYYLRDTLLRYDKVKSTGENIYFTADNVYEEEPDTLQSSYRNICEQLITLKNEGKMKQNKKLKDPKNDISLINSTEIKSESEAFRKMGDSLMFLKEYGKAIEHYNFVVNSNERDYETHLNMGLAYQKISEYKKSIDAFEKAKKFAEDDNSPKILDIYWGLGLSYNNIENTDKAKLYLDKFIKMSKDKAYQSVLDRDKLEIGYFQLASVHAKLKNRKETLHFLKFCFEISPNWKDAVKEYLPEFSWLQQDADFQALVGE